MANPTKRILLVEDNPDDADLMLAAFEDSKLVNQIDVARDGQEALDYLLNGRPPPQLVLLDLKLPKVDGLEVLRQLRANEKTRLLPVVILTSSREEGDRLRGYLHGANSYIQKPVDFDRFLEGVRQVGLYWLVLNEPPPQA